MARVPRQSRDVVIRPLAPSDLDALVAIYLSLAEHHARLAPDRYRVPEAAAVRARFAPVADDLDPGNLHLVAEVDGRVVGQLDAWGGAPASAGSTRRSLATAEVGLAVLAAYRGRGIGTALIAAAERWARERGLDEIRLEVATENDGAARLYARLGYEPATVLLTKRIR